MNEQYWPATVQQCLVFIGIARGSFGQCAAVGIFIGLAAIRVSRRVIVARRFESPGNAAQIAVLSASADRDYRMSTYDNAR
jgi:hypothetical protein